MLKSLFVIIALLLAMPGAQAARSLTLASAAVGGTNPQQIAATAFAAEIERRLPGRFKIDVKGGSTLGGEADLWDAVRLGTLDLAIVTTTSIAPRVPQLGVIDIPFLFRDGAHATQVLDGPVGRALGNRINATGVVFLGYIDRGFRHVTNSRHPVRSPADLAGLKMRVIPNPVCEETFKSLGAEVLPMPIPELYGALRDRRIDGQENPLPIIESRRFDQVQKFLSLTAHSYSPAVILVSADAYNSLNARERGAFATAARAAAKATRQAVATSEESALAHLKGRGMQITESVERDAFVTALAPLWPEWEKRFGARLLQQIRATR